MQNSSSAYGFQRATRQAKFDFTTILVLIWTLDLVYPL